MRTAGVSFEVALADAQRRGFAEADPSLDVDGWDAVHKLVILAWLGLGSRVAPEAVDRVGIRHVAGADVAALAQLGYRVRLVAHAERAPGGAAVHLRVRPTAVATGHLLHDVEDADNAVIISSDLAGRVMLRGLGAGGASTASAVVSDIVTAVRERKAPADRAVSAPGARGPWHPGRRSCRRARLRADRPHRHRAARRPRPGARDAGHADACG